VIPLNFFVIKLVKLCLFSFFYSNFSTMLVVNKDVYNHYTHQYNRGLLLYFHLLHDALAVCVVRLITMMS